MPISVQQLLKKLSIGLFFLVLSLPSFATARKDSCILFINTYNEATPLSDNISGMLIRNLPRSHKATFVAFESLNLLQVNSYAELDTFKTRLFKAYEMLTPKMIIMEGNAPWALLHEDIEKHWKDVPIILRAEKEYMGPVEAYLNKQAIPYSQRIPLGQVLHNKNVVVVHAPFYLQETINLMQKLQPQMEQLAFISDGRWISAQNREELKELVAQMFPNLKVKYYTEGQLSTDDILDSLKYSDERTGLLLFSWYQRDVLSTKDMYNTRGYRVLARQTDVPIFTLSDIGVRDGELVGGYFQLFDSISTAITRVAIDILEGKEARFLPTVYVKGEPVFSYRDFTRVGFSQDACPPSTYFYEKPDSFWDKYKYHVSGAILIFLSIVLIMYYRILAEKKVRHMQAQEIKTIRKYDHLFNNMPIAYLHLRTTRDENNRITDYTIEGVNPTFRQLILPKEEAMIKDFTWRLDTKRRQDFMKRLDLVCETQRKITIQYFHPETQRSFSLLLNPSEGEGEIDMFCVDNTDLAQAQHLLRTVNHKLTMALEVSNMVPWKWDLNNNTILCDINRPLELAGMGEHAEEQLSVPDREYFSKICKEDRDRVRKAYQDLILGKVVKIKEEYRVLSLGKDGQRIFEWVEAQATVDQCDENGSPLTLIGSSQVITERKMMERELISAKDQAEEASRLKSAFLANMSHEIRTPLNAIIGFSGILASAKAEEEKQEYMSIIENNNTLLLQLINDILDLSKIEAGTLEFAYTNIDLNELLREIEQTSRLKPGTENLTIDFEKSVPDCFINTEKNRLMQVITNFISNAIKFTTEGSIRFGYRIEENNLHFYVSDTGCGIPKEAANEIFGRFVKLNNFVQGTGLGLAICETIIKNMHGSIGVDSEEGKGSTFWFKIPYRPVKITEKQVKEYKQITVNKTQEERLTVLIAEDNASNYRLLESIFREEYDLLHAWNGREAVELYNQHRPEMILMDINMPEMNGYEATKAIREISDSVPIIALTAYAFTSDEEKIMDSGFDAYTPKPLDANRLRNQLKELQRSRMLFL